MFKNLLLTVFLTSPFLPSLLQAQANPGAEKNVLVISDIDDTIKLSHVLSKRSAVLRAMDSNSWFLGMNSLYQLVNHDHPQAHFVYISAAPEFLLEETHRKLLTNGQFPQGEYIARNRFVSSLNHKLIAIRKVLQQRKPNTVIFIGDNGEKDPVVYNQITNEFKNSGIQFHTFIRMVYSPKDPEMSGRLTSLSPGQFLFVTPVELGLELRRRYLISETSSTWLADKLTDFIMQETPDHRFGVLAFPTFLDCRGFRWPYAAEPVRFKYKVTDLFLQQKLKNLAGKIAYRCSKSFSDDNDDDTH